MTVCTAPQPLRRQRPAPSGMLSQVGFSHAQTLWLPAPKQRS